MDGQRPSGWDRRPQDLLPSRPVLAALCALALLTVAAILLPAVAQVPGSSSWAAQPAATGPYSSGRTFPDAISVWPAVLTSTQYVNEVTTQPLTISNSSEVTLTFVLGGVGVTGAGLWLHLDEPAGATTFYDASGHGNHGTCSGAACPLSGVEGVWGTAARFDGLDDSVQVPHGPLFDAIEDVNKLTVAAWFNIGGWDNRRFPIVDKYELDGAWGWYTMLYSSWPWIQFDPGTAPAATCTYSFDLDRWYHLAVSYDRSVGTIWFYVDGEQVCVESYTEVLKDTAGEPLYIGENASGISEYANGILDEVVIYDRALSAQEVAELYLFGSGAVEAPWLTLDPLYGTVPPESSVQIQVTLDATKVLPGIYATQIDVQSSDPLTPVISVPVTMTVRPTADMGRVAGAVSDAWTGLPLTATVELVGVYSTTASPDFEIWATAGSYDLVANAPGYYTVTYPVTIVAGGLTRQDVALEPPQPRLEWTPASIEATIARGESKVRVLTIQDTGPLPLDVALFETVGGEALYPLSSGDDLAGIKILYDRAHGEPSLGDYGTLAADLEAAGASLTENWIFPVDASVVEGYDVLWVNCCGGISWTEDERSAIGDWLSGGGAVLVQGERSASTMGPAGVLGVYYLSATCTEGITADIRDHPISAGVERVTVAPTCWALTAGGSAEFVVFDPAGQVHGVAQEQSWGKMVVLAGADLADAYIDDQDNRLLGNNIMAWLARPSYIDVPWLAVAPESGTMAGHSSLEVSVGLDASALRPGVYRAALAVEHNDPDQPSPVMMPVELTVVVRRYYLPLVPKRSD